MSNLIGRAMDRVWRGLLTGLAIIGVSSLGYAGYLTVIGQGAPNAGGATNSWFIQGAGAPGAGLGGLLGVQGDPGGTPVPVACPSCTPAQQNSSSYSPTSTSAYNLSIGGAAVSALPILSAGLSYPVLIDSASGGALETAAQDAPFASTQIAINASGSGALTATLTGAAGKFTYLCGYDIHLGATAATVGNGTVTGLAPATWTFPEYVAAVAAGIARDNQTFRPCLKSSAANTNIVVSSPNPGAGGTASINAWGYLQ